MDDVPVSAFATPSRSLSREQFHSLRQKMVRESPRLYREKILSDPSEKPKRQVHSAPVTPRSYVRETRGSLLREADAMDLGSDQLDEQNDGVVGNKRTPVENMGSGEPGNYENPVLDKLASRTVNKEMETQIIVTNLIVLAIWDLSVKFVKIFLDYSHLGKIVISVVQERFWKLKLGIWIYRLRRELPWLVEKLSWSTLDTAFHLVVAYNVLGSLWRLFSKVKVNDLDLNRSQRELLGLQPNDEFADPHASQQSSKKPHVILDQNRRVSSARENGSVSVPATPFLFKSLETPLKAKQREQTQQQQQQQQQQQTQLDLQRQAQSASVSKINAFGSNFGKIETRPGPWTTSQVGPAGYIPSSKYAYMMSSPSPRKRM